MASPLALCFLLLSTVLGASAQNATRTTLQPVFAFPFDGTSTIYESTATVKSAVDCSGSVLVVSTFAATIAQGTANTATVTSPLTTSSEFACAPSTSPPSPTSSISLPPTATPTAVPPPSIDPVAQTFIDELRTAILYVSLIANHGNQPKLCSAIDPMSLSNGTGLNGTAVQREVCASAAIQQFLPSFSEVLTAGNQIGLGYLTTALFAVQVVSGFGGGNNRTTLCNEIDETLINNLFIGYINGTGTAVKRYVCNGA
ncbi:MAG: hypothetical protein Q9219_006527 [cf. Caloplaca sp. 3 TL-2023]